MHQMEAPVVRRRVSFRILSSEQERWCFGASVFPLGRGFLLEGDALTGAFMQKDTRATQESQRRGVFHVATKRQIPSGGTKEPDLNPGYQCRRFGGGCNSRVLERLAARSTR